MDEETQRKQRLRGMITTGARLVGGAAGAAVGAAALGPAGAFVLGAIGTALQDTFEHVGTEIADRLLGPRERVRVGMSMVMAADRIREKLREGSKPRSDGFFEERADGRSDAEEIAESIFTRAQRETEEKKLKYLSNMLASFAFDPNISISYAQQLTKLAESLTYRQLVLLAIGGSTGSLGFPLRSTDYRQHGKFDRSIYEILYEAHDLIIRGYLGNGGNATLGITDVVPSLLRIQGVGFDLYMQMQLNDIPIDERVQVASTLT